MHHMEAEKAHREKAWWQLHKNATSYIEQILEATVTKQQLYGHLPLIFKTIQIRRTRHAGYYWRSKGELISDILQWTLSHGRGGLENLLNAMDDRDEWRGESRKSVLAARHDDDDLKQSVTEMPSSDCEPYILHRLLLDLMLSS